MSLEVGEIENILKRLTSRVTKISGCALVTSEGLPVATSVMKGADADALAAMAALVSMSGDEASKELFNVGFSQLIVRNEKGFLVLSRVTEDFFLVAKVGREARLGLLFLYLDKVSKEINEIVTGQSGKDLS